VPERVGGAKSQAWQWRELHSFDVNDYVTEAEIKLAKDGSDEATDDTLVRALVRHVSESGAANNGFDEKRAHWSVTVIKMIGAKGAAFTGVHVRLHHAIADGITLVRTSDALYNGEFDRTKNILCKKLDACLDRGYEFDLQTSDLDALLARRIIPSEVKATHGAGKKVQSTELDHKAGKKLARKADRSFGAYTAALVDYWKLFATEPPLPHSRLRNAEKGLANECVLATSRGYLVQSLILVSKHFDGTLNDLMTTLFLHGLASWLRENESSKTRKLLQDASGGKDMALRFIAIFSTRSAQQSTAEECVEDLRRGVSANEVASVPMRLPLGPMTLDKRFKLVKKTYDDLKNGVSPQTSVALTRVAYALGGVSLVNRVVDAWASKCVGMISNVTGSILPLPLSEKDGAIYRMLNSTNPTKFPFSIAIISYMGRMHLTVSADKNCMSQAEVEDLTRRIDATFDEAFGQLPSENYDWF
jgi:hypothetical protein